MQINHPKTTVQLSNLFSVLCSFHNSACFFLQVLEKMVFDSSSSHRCINKSCQPTKYFFCLIPSLSRSRRKKRRRRRRRRKKWKERRGRRMRRRMGRRRGGGGGGWGEAVWLILRTLYCNHCHKFKPGLRRRGEEDEIYSSSPSVDGKKRPWNLLLSLSPRPCVC